MNFRLLHLLSPLYHTDITPIYADLFLLWLEGRRATHANEAMIAAVRLAWWRDAIANQKTSQSVPLADRLLALMKENPSGHSAGYN